MKKYTKQILAMLALNAIYSGSGILILSFINKYLLDGAERGGRIIVLFFALLALFLLLSVLSRIMLCKMENDFVFDLRTKIIKQIIDTKFERIEAASKANLLASLSSDISRLTEGFMRISELIQGAMIVLFCGIYVLYIAPMMFVFLFVWIGALMIFNRFLMKKVMQNYDLYRQNEDVLYKNYAAAIEGHKELSLSLAKAKSLYENDFLPNAQNLRQSSLRAEVYGAFASNFMNVMMLGAVGFVLYFGLSGGKVELANAVTIALTVLFLRAPLMMLIFSLPSVLRAKIAYAKINELGLDPFVQGFELAQMQPWRSLELKEVGFSYPDGKFGIKGVNLQLNAGETVFLIGENGSGKSTLFMILAGLYTPQTGEILADGVALKPSDLRAYSNNISAVFSDFYLFDYATGDAEIARGASIAGVAEDAELGKRIRRAYQVSRKARRLKESRGYTPCPSCGRLIEGTHCHDCARAQQRELRRAVRRVLRAQPWAKLADVVREVPACDALLLGSERADLVREIANATEYTDQTSDNAYMITMLHRSIPRDQVTSKHIRLTFWELRNELVTTREFWEEIKRRKT